MMRNRGQRTVAQVRTEVRPPGTSTVRKQGRFDWGTARHDWGAVQAFATLNKVRIRTL
jgi:hypothetical protein